MRNDTARSIQCRALWRLPTFSLEVKVRPAAVPSTAIRPIRLCVDGVCRRHRRGGVHAVSRHGVDVLPRHAWWLSAKRVALYSNRAPARSSYQFAVAALDRSRPFTAPVLRPPRLPAPLIGWHHDSYDSCGGRCNPGAEAHLGPRACPGPCAELGLCARLGLCTCWAPHAIWSHLRSRGRRPFSRALEHAMSLLSSAPATGVSSAVGQGTYALPTVGGASLGCKIGQGRGGRHGLDSDVPFSCLTMAPEGRVFIRHLVLRAFDGRLSGALCLWGSATGVALPCRG